MIHVISIKKKNIIFFLISILFSAIITFSMNQLGLNKESTDKLYKCKKYISFEILNTYNSSVLFNYMNILFDEELIKLTQNDNNLIVNKNNVFFKQSNCEKEISYTLENFDKIEIKIRNKLFDLITNMDERGASFPIYDQILIFDLENIKFLNLTEKKSISIKGKLYTKMFIQFLLITILLNTLYFLQRRIKINLK